MASNPQGVRELQRKQVPRPTTAVRHPDNFRDRAAVKPQHAMFYMFMAAFGYTLHDGIADLQKMIQTANWNMFSLCVAASIQVRGNVVALSDDLFRIRTDYPKIYLPGRAGKDDVYNFYALHVLGHLIMNVAGDHRHARSALEKAGDCIFGRYLTDIKTEAQGINLEIAESFSQAQKNEVAAFIEDNPDLVTTVKRVLDAVEPFAAQFARYLTNVDHVPQGAINGAQAVIVGVDQE